MGAVVFMGGGLDQEGWREVDPQDGVASYSQLTVGPSATSPNSRSGGACAACSEASRVPTTASLVARPLRDGFATFVVMTSLSCPFQMQVPSKLRSSL